MDTRRLIAEAFSGHRFTEVHDHLAPDVRWVLPGRNAIEGKTAVVSACDSSAAEMAQLAAPVREQGRQRVRRLLGGHL